jgi:hypothetical protein
MTNSQTSRIGMTINSTVNKTSGHPWRSLMRRLLSVL